MSSLPKLPHRMCTGAAVELVVAAEPGQRVIALSTAKRVVVGAVGGNDRRQVRLVTGPVLPLRRLLISEARRFPELAIEYRRRAPEAVMRSLSTALRTLADAGPLPIDDSDIAPEHFAFLIMGADMDRGMFDQGAASDLRVLAQRLPPPANHGRLAPGEETSRRRPL